MDIIVIILQKDWSVALRTYNFPCTSHGQVQKSSDVRPWPLPWPWPWKYEAFALALTLECESLALALHANALLTMYCRSNYIHACRMMHLIVLCSSYATDWTCLLFTYFVNLVLCRRLQIYDLDFILWSVRPWPWPWRPLAMALALALTLLALLTSLFYTQSKVK